MQGEVGELRENEGKGSSVSKERGSKWKRGERKKGK